jgi:hypothetical protein
MPFKDPEKAKQYNTEYKRNWISRHKQRYDAYITKYNAEHRDQINSSHQKHYWNNREKEIIRVMEGNKRRYRRERLECIEHYGNKCDCCGEEHIQFLAIDHIDGNGNAHRKELRTKHLTIYEYLIKNNYPEGFRVLCHNCNASIGFYGYCPHQVERGELTEDDLIKIEVQKTLERKEYHAKNRQE